MAEAPDISDADVLESYLVNDEKEELTVERARSFKRQFAELYRDRKPLYLLPKNECEVEKHICTFLRPSRLPFDELYYFDSCGEFVSDYITYEPLSNCTEPPETLRAPMTSLRLQAGNCFEMSMALCCLLTGVGYDAYCVIGYAAKGITTLDESTEMCPLLDTPEEAADLDDTMDDIPKSRYQIKPPKDLKSKFLFLMDKREKDEVEALERKKEEEEAARLAELNKKKPDVYHGLRIHSWVLVLHGKREVAKSFFIEPSTGLRMELDTEKYLGLECVFNHANYWVNMQDCGQGIKELVYDLGDSTLWEAMFTMDSEQAMSVKVPVVGENPEPAAEDDEDDEFDEDAYLASLTELPHSWTEPIDISQLEFDSRCPNGHKTTLYKKAKLENHGLYQNKRGLITRIIEYSDDLWKVESTVHEKYVHRSDHLLERIMNKEDKTVRDIFGRGHTRSLKEHFYRTDETGPEARREITYHISGRKDDLSKREHTATDLIEYFENREDFLYERHVQYGPRTKKFGPASEGKLRPILKIDEYFRRNEAKPAETDVHHRTFNFVNDRIVLRFHHRGDDVTQDVLRFLRPKGEGSTFTLTMDMVEHYRVRPASQVPNWTRLDLHRMYTKLQDEREKLLKTIRQIAEEVVETLQEREEEEQKLELEISMYDPNRNHEAKRKREELERQRIEAIRIRKEKEKDYLSPFLIRLGDPPQLTGNEAATVRYECMDAFRKRLEHQATLMHDKFKLETKELMRVQNVFQEDEKAGLHSTETEQRYKEECEGLNYRLNMLQRRIQKHREMAVKKFRELENRLDADPRLAAYDAMLADAMPKTPFQQQPSSTSKGSRMSRAGN